MYIQYLGEIVPSPSQNTLGVCKLITLLIPHSISSRLVTLLKFTVASIQVTNIFGLTVSFKFLNFRFRTCLLFVPEILASFMSNSVQIIYIAPSDFHLFLHLKKFLGGKRFDDDDDDLKDAVQKLLTSQAAAFYEQGIQKLVPRYDKCLSNGGEYVEKYFEDCRI